MYSSIKHFSRWLTILSLAICSRGPLAYASHCMLDMGDNYRPVAGYTNICPLVSLLMHCYCIYLNL